MALMPASLAFVAINLACFIVASLLAVRSPFYRSQLAAPANGRVQRAEMIDGLRGWLALGVFFSHTAYMHTYLTRGEWDFGAWPLFDKAGHVGVSLFFMVTAYLFWGRVLRSNGNLPLKEFFGARLRRIVPMYLASVFMVFLVVAFQSGFQLHEGPIALVKEMRPWFAFGFLTEGDINGVRAHYIEAVHWTLAYEWAFYLLLPILALFAGGARFPLMLAVAAFYCIATPVTLCFICGMVVATIVERRLIPFSLAKRWLTPLPLAALLLAFTYDYTYTPMPLLLLAVFFFFIVKDNSLFGLLGTRGAKLLGTISYSIYLVHCIVLYAVVALVNAYVPISSLGIGTYFSLCGVVGVLTVLLSAATYQHIEYPFIALRGGWRLPPLFRRFGYSPSQ